MRSPSPFDHVRPADGDYRDGIYRVVGTSDDAVTLLRVADADGRRRHTGDVIAVPQEELEGFDRAENPDGNSSPARNVASALEASYWSLRTFARELVANPVPTALFASVLLAGSLELEPVALPDGVHGVLVLAGSLGLAYVGSGRRLPA